MLPLKTLPGKPLGVGSFEHKQPFFLACVKEMCAQSCSTLCDPMDYSLPGSSVHRIFQARILEWVTIFLLQGIFPTQGLNPCLLCLLHCRRILYLRSHMYTCMYSACMLNRFSRATSWTAACQTPLPMEFSRQESWSG